MNAVKEEELHRGSRVLGGCHKARDDMSCGLKVVMPRVSLDVRVSDDRGLLRRIEG